MPRLRVSRALQKTDLLSHMGHLPILLLQLPLHLLVLSQMSSASGSLRFHLIDQMVEHPNLLILLLHDQDHILVLSAHLLEHLLLLLELVLNLCHLLRISERVSAPHALLQHVSQSHALVHVGPQLEVELLDLS